MKKAVSLILILAVCVSVCACGQPADSNLPPEIQAPSQPTELAIPTSPPESTESHVNVEETPEFQAVLGKWTLIDEDDTVPGEIEFFEDYTCLVGGISYSWELHDASGAGECVARILNIPERGYYNFMLFLKEDTGAYYAYIHNINMSIYAKPDDWEIIEITPENLFDYYELVNEDFYFIKDEFGEYKEYSFSQQLVLKEEYADRDFVHNDGLTKIVMEISYSMYNQQVDVDLENLTAVFTGEPRLDSTSTRIYTFTSDGCGLWSCLRGIGGGMLYYDDIEILRTKGQLWLKKEP